MSDDSYKDGRYGKATQAGVGGVPNPVPKRGGVEVRTMIGLPIISPAPAVRAGLTGKPPEAASHPAPPPVPVPVPVTTTRRPPPPAPAPSGRAGPDSLYESDTRYMDPPSEALGHARTQQSELPPQSMQPPMSHAPTQPIDQPDPGEGFLGYHAGRQAHQQPQPQPAQTAQPAPMYLSEQSASGPFGGGHQSRSEPYARPGHNDHRSSPAAEHSSHSAHSSPHASGPGQRYSNAQAPEAWRNDMRRVAAQRGPSLNVPSPAPPAPSAAPASPNTAGQTQRKAASTAAPAPGSLRLKLDLNAAEREDFHYKGVPKSSLPRILIWLVILGGGGAGAAYWVDTQGGVDNAVVKLMALKDSLTGEAPPAASPSGTPAQDPTQQPPAATVPGAATGAGAPGTTELNQPSNAPAAQPSAAAPTNPTAAPSEQPRDGNAPGQPPATQAQPSAAAPAADNAPAQAHEPSKPAHARAVAKPTRAAEKAKAKPAQVRAAPAAAPSHQDPVVKIKAEPGPDLPPDPSGPNYPGPSLPPLDPPSPDSN